MSSGKQAPGQDEGAPTPLGSSEGSPCTAALQHPGEQQRAPSRVRQS